MPDRNKIKLVCVSQKHLYPNTITSSVELCC